ncbi:inositol hexakisphosphate kinase 3 [Blastocystis sp. subtype 4]|uniref:inositol hexakisphosphate kinase 3 n=1 Tax=Blastocystis sp. subtype 4 TaxID=944170 RepID=UPI000711D923|nr:inositol hexakisphosphate kinase 3 [Blastocystis sp. subtype 4]KNB44306.1 inositol hexakisphosphate kinase 3 [Blastocystis sp. subtype 4]|eukprot:XP_014527741.1 inositol hexakisphosphate kinase 3 [Blastocystis sp. subtype 4]
MFSLRSGRIAKPYSSNERFCYKTAFQQHSPLTRYIARYYGSCSLDDLRLLSDDPTLDITFPKEHITVSVDNVYPESISQTNRFIIIENLEEGFKYPCMLDIKLGTRMYWDGAPRDKIERHVATCKATTSGSLGMRICGMRVLYCPQTGSWTYQEKAWGKSLQADDMLDAVALFFFDGVNLRIDLMDEILDKLCEIRDAVEACTWRFWSSSLLFVYEGGGESHVDIHLIDFANCNFANSYTTPDEGYLLGISNLIATIRLLQNGKVSVKELLVCELRKQLFG